MSLPVFRSATAAEAVVGSALTLGEDVAGHAVRVRRIGPGEEIEIVDGDGTLDADGALHVRPSTAVLHRASSWSGHEDHDSDCGNDCRPIG